MPSSSLIPLRPPRPTLFPYTTLFRSSSPPGSTDSGSGMSPRGVRLLGGRRPCVIEALTARRSPAPWPSHPTATPSPPAISIRQSCSGDRKSTRLNSSHANISYAVFFFNSPPTTAPYTLSLHDALPIFITAGLDGLRLWDVATGREVARRPAPMRDRGSYGPSFASALAVAPDGHTVATGHLDSTILLWRSEEHTSELQSRQYLVCRLLL